MDKILSVEGKANISIKPNITILEFELEGKNRNYDELVKELAFNSNQIKDILVNLGFIRTDVKTTYFSIDPDFEEIRDNNIYKKNFIGYKYKEVLKIKYNNDNNLTSNILEEIANSNINPKIDIKYEVKDKTKAINEALSEAVKDAKGKAKTIAKAAGIELGEIININYGKIERYDKNLEITPFKTRSLLSVNHLSLDIEPDDIDIFDQVVVIYSIK